jgi:hypothetical protein
MGEDGRETLGAFRGGRKDDGVQVFRYDFHLEEEDGS